MNRIAVCIKQVPSASNVKLDPETHRIVREGIETVVNPYDLYALQWALCLKRWTGCRITALCMGPRAARNSLYEALAVGADDAYLLNDKNFGGSDTLATARVLSEAIRRLEGVSLVLCGKQAIDGDTGQVGPGIAARLGWTQATYVTDISTIEPTSVTVSRRFENYSDTAVCSLPAVIAVEKSGPVPRIPSLEDWLTALDKEIVRWSAEDVELEESSVGLKGSATKVARTEVAAFEEKNTMIIRGTAAQSATRLFIELARRGLY